ncbi:hypothetical protein PENSPDRAFT_748266 [Peniophora sp. CONT]|nr:hypothetical protein PENSPDRAFT_748266 [Peniophora sp. CONT]
MAINWNDPVLLAEQYLDFIKLQHALGGVYIWELVMGIKYDLQLLKKRQRHASSIWAKWVYLACRYCALGAVVTIFAGFNVTSEINCKVWIIFVFIWAFFAIQLASTLIAIRVVAIWHNSTIMIGLCTAVLATQLAFFAHELSQADAAWLPTNSTCLVLDTQTSKANVTTTLLTDLFLLVVMLVGLFRWREARTSDVWKLLWNQGLIWLALATIAEVPTVVFVWLNLNQVMNLVFFTPEMIILVIGATRMYRRLSAHFTAVFDPSTGYSSTSHSGPSDNPDIPMRRLRVPATEIAFREVVTLDGPLQKTEIKPPQDRPLDSRSENMKMGIFPNEDQPAGRV